MARKIGVEIVGDSSKLEHAFARSSRSAKRFNSDIGRLSRGAAAGSGIFSGLGRQVAFASGAFLGGAGLVSAVRAAFDEMSKAQQAAAQTAAVIKSTGGVAGVSAKHVDTLAASLLNLSGVDDELIKNSENLLLTFTKVRNVVGKGNDIFDQAAKSALDLSVRFGKDLPSATVLVGKALQDPIRGLTALSRTGVQFTEQQKKTIKTLVESGHLLAAQKIILSELRRETGGAAAAYGDTLAGKLNIAKETILNLAGAIAATLLPALTNAVDKAVAWLQNTKNQKEVVDKVTGAISTLGRVLSKTADIGQTIAAAVGGWKNAIAGLVGAWAGFKVAGVLAAQQVMFANIVAAEGTAAAWRAALISTGFGAIAVAAGIVAAEVIAHWEAVKKFFQGFWLWMQQIADRTFLAIVEPFSHLPSKLGGWARDLKKQVEADVKLLDQAAANLENRPAAKRRTGAATIPASSLLPAAEVGGAAPPPSGTIPKGGVTKKERQDRAARLRRAAEAARQSVTDRLAFNVERAGLTKSLSDDLAALKKLNSVLLRRIRGGHDTLEMERQQLGVQQQITDVLKQQSDEHKRQAQERKKQAQAKAAAQAAAQSAIQFKLLGLGPSGEELVPGVKTLQKKLGEIEKKLADTVLGQQKKGLLEKLRRILGGRLGKVRSDVRRAIQGIIDDLQSQIEGLSGDDTATGGKPAWGSNFFSMQQMRQPTWSPVFYPAGGGTPITINGGLNLYGVQDVAGLETELGKRANQRQQPRRGF